MPPRRLPGRRRSCRASRGRRPVPRPGAGAGDAVHRRGVDPSVRCSGDVVAHDDGTGQVQALDERGLGFLVESAVERQQDLPCPLFGGHCGHGPRRGGRLVPAAAAPGPSGRVPARGKASGSSGSVADGSDGGSGGCAAAVAAGSADSAEGAEDSAEGSGMVLRAGGGADDEPQNRCQNRCGPGSIVNTFTFSLQSGHRPDATPALDLSHRCLANCPAIRPGRKPDGAGKRTAQHEGAA